MSGGGGGGGRGAGAPGRSEKCGVIKTLPPPQIITDENCTPLGNTPPSPISAVISKVQCQRQKRIKEWRHQGGYKQWVRCVPFRMANSDVIKCHQYQLRPCVCAELQGSSIPRLSWSFVKYGLTQLCMLTQDKSTKSEESYIYSGHTIGGGLVKSLNQGLWLHIQIQFSQLQIFISLWL